MSTTKLTRKEIAADPIHDALINTVEILRANVRLILMSAGGLAVLLLGVYFGLDSLIRATAAPSRSLRKAWISIMGGGCRQRQG